MNNSTQCSNCGYPYNPISSRWLCPNCHWKDTCCEGEACEYTTVVEQHTQTYKD